MTELAPNQLHSVSVTAEYVADPLALFTQLTTPNDNSLLLESAEIDTKAGTQSLLLVDACARLVCNGLDVAIEALNDNGEALLECLQTALPADVKKSRQNKTLKLAFPAVNSAQDEDSRLKALSVFDTLRTLLLQLHCQQGKESLFLGGIFS